MLVLDQATGYMWSYFLKKKSELKGEPIDLIKDLKQKMKYEVKYLRCDNAGENMDAEKEGFKEGYKPAYDTFGYMIGAFFEFWT